ncbi:MAG TPA: hypothetical protein EYF95_02590 [Flavobacteriales bacterium]|nr:hypothetical protein [Flavobacteriales bacterium]
MILLDFSQTMIGCFMSIGRGRVVVEEDLLRHTVLNSIRQYRRQFREYDASGFVICCDSKLNWRKESFPEYKGNRKKKKADDTTDWTSLYAFLDEMIKDLRENFPYKVIQVDRAEADDIIAVLNEHVAVNPTLIISSDKDFLQLHKYEGVVQYSPLMKKFITGDPAESLYEKVIRGDAGDGVPNILSSDDTLITDGKRQKPVTKKKLELWRGKKPEEFCTEDMLRNYHRNKAMVDLSETPESIRINIINQFEEQVPKSGKLMSYFVEKRLNDLMKHISDF